MPLVTGSENFTECKVQYSTNNGASWTDITDYVASITMDGGTRQTGVAYTFGAESGIVGHGKTEPVTVTLRVLYTEESNSPARVAYNQYASKGQFMVRWFPESGDLGELGYQTYTDAKVINNPIPVGEAATPDPIAVDVQVYTSFVVRVAAT